MLFYSEILFVLVLILINGFFAMSEIALVSARKVRLEQKADGGDKGAKIALELTHSTNNLLSSVQVGITLVGILTGALGGATVAERLSLVLEKVSWLAPYASGGFNHDCGSADNLFLAGNRRINPQAPGIE